MTKRRAKSNITSSGSSLRPVWNDDDFNLDSFGVEAPLEERLEALMRDGFTPDQVSEDIREKYEKYLKRKGKQRLGSGREQ